MNRRYQEEEDFEPVDGAMVMVKVILAIAALVVVFMVSSR